MTEEQKIREIYPLIPKTDKADRLISYLNYKLIVEYYKNQNKKQLHLFS